MLCVAKPVRKKDLNAAEDTKKRKADLRKTLMRGDKVNCNDKSVYGYCVVLSVLTVYLVVSLIRYEHVVKDLKTIFGHIILIFFDFFYSYVSFISLMSDRVYFYL